ncbi:MAG: hypothetical protein LBB18_01305 [Puniceicoccales bacterium]|jgi:hypothetical protein|nr:hypothetical protein [Puniceicoccales bacterium]
MKATQDETVLTLDEVGSEDFFDGKVANTTHSKAQANEHTDVVEDNAIKDKDFAYTYRIAKEAGISHDSACFIANESIGVHRKSSELIGEFNVSRHIDPVFVVGTVDNYIRAFAIAKRAGADDAAAADSANGVVIGCHTTYSNAIKVCGDSKTSAERKTIKTAAAAAALAVAKGYVDSWTKAFTVAAEIGDDLDCAIAFANGVAANYQVDHDEAAKVDNSSNAVVFADGAAGIHAIVYKTARADHVDSEIARNADWIAASERRDAYINARNKDFSHTEAHNFANETAIRWNTVYHETRKTEGDHRATLIASSKLPHI